MNLKKWTLMPNQELEPRWAGSTTQNSTSWSMISSPFGPVLTILIANSEPVYSVHTILSPYITHCSKKGYTKLQITSFIYIHTFFFSKTQCRLKCSNISMHAYLYLYLYVHLWKTWLDSRSWDWWSHYSYLAINMYVSLKGSNWPRGGDE